jgi:hypothetical protein
MLLMLSLPLQALAAASMPDCALDAVPAHQTAEALQIAACHESDHPDNTATPHSCKHCAACALAAALPAPLDTSLALAPAAKRFMMQPAASFSGFIPGSPERPPRFSPA